MAYRSFGRFRQASTHLDTPPSSLSHYPVSNIAPAATRNLSRKADDGRQTLTPPLWISRPPTPDSRRSLRRATYPQLLHHAAGHGQTEKPRRAASAVNTAARRYQGKAKSRASWDSGGSINR